jgi:hypothetical protein
VKPFAEIDKQLDPLLARIIKKGNDETDEKYAERLQTNKERIMFAILRFVLNFIAKLKDNPLFGPFVKEYSDKAQELLDRIDKSYCKSDRGRI